MTPPQIQTLICAEKALAFHFASLVPLCGRIRGPNVWVIKEKATYPLRPRIVAFKI